MTRPVSRPVFDATWHASGSLMTAAIGFILTPIYLSFVGREGYGLIGAGVAIAGVVALLDFGMVMIIQRETAQTSEDDHRRRADLLRTFELASWSMATVVMLVGWLASGVVVRWWLQSDVLPYEDLASIFAWSVAVAALQLPIGVYSGSLLGANRHALFNGIQVGAALLRHGSAIAMLAVIQGGVPGFFASLLLSSVVISLLYRGIAWHQLDSALAEFKIEIVTGTWRFAVGLFAISVTSVLLSYLDKIILLGMLTLKDYALYALAWSSMPIIYIGVGAIGRTWMPRFAAMSSKVGVSGCEVAYREASRLSIALMATAMVFSGLFPKSAIFAWTNDASLSSACGPIFALVAIGTACNGLMNLPFVLLLAAGRTRVPLFINLVCLVLVLPAMVGSVMTWGVIGGGISWLFLNGVVCLGIVLQIIHQYLFRSWCMWWWRDLMCALAAAAIPGLMLLAADPFGPGRWGAAALVVVAMALSLGGALGWWAGRVRVGRVLSWSRAVLLGGRGTV